MPRKISKVNFKLKHMELFLMALVLVIGAIILYVIHRRTTNAINANINNVGNNITSVANNVTTNVNNVANNITSVTTNVPSQDRKLILFYAEWCGASRQFLPVWDEIVESVKIETQKVNVDENQEMAKEYEIQYLPTLYLVSGKTRVKYDGSRTKNNILEFVSA